MGAALEAGLDLGALAGCFVAIAFLTLVAFTFRRLAAVLNVGIFGVHPFAGVADAIDNTVVAGLNEAIKQVERVAARFLSGLIDAFGMILGLFVIPFLALKEVFAYLWNSALVPKIHSITNAIEATAVKALGRVNALERDIAGDVARIDHDIASAANAVLRAAEAEVVATARTLEHDFTRGLNDLTGTFERDLERIARGIEANVGTSLDALRRAENAVVAEAERAISATADELRQFERTVPLTDIAGVIAAVPLLRAIVNTLEAETGLDNAECRGKVKGICGVDPSAWEGLLAGLIGGFAMLNFREIVRVGSGIAREMHDDFRRYAGESR